MTRSLVRPLTRSLTRSLLRGPSIDADAAAYIDALVSGGATVSSVQSSAIDTFIRAEKSGSRWDLIKRLYLPIWELAAPNAICMRSLTSGTFVNSPTMGAGHFALNGTTQYFDTKFNVLAGGLTPGSSWSGAMWLDIGGFGQTGVINTSASENVLMFTNDPGVISDICSGTAGGRNLTVVATPEAREGIFSANRRDGVMRHRIMRGSGITASANYSHANSGTMPNGDFYWGVRNRLDGVTPSLFMPAKFGAMWNALGCPGDGDEAFLDNLKNLWKSCTGLAFPTP